MENHLFNEVFARNGKIYTPQEDSEVELIAIFLRDFDKIIKDIKPSFLGLPEIEFNFLDGNHLGAHATIQNGRYYIAIQKGSLKILMDIFLRMLACPSILSKLGRSAEEKKIEKVDLAQIGNYERFLFRDIKMEVPKDIRRAEVAVKMLRSAMRQLFLHELGHLLRGHYHWLYVENNVTNCAPLIRQGMEIDADRFGINLVLNQLKLEDELAAQPNTHHLLEEQLFIWAFALATMLNLVPRLERIEDFNNENTPPIALRYGIMTAEAIFTVFKDHSKIENIKIIMFEAMKLPENAFSKIQTDYPYTHFKMSSSQEIINHHQKIRMAWMKFENELSAVSLINLGYQ